MVFMAATQASDPSGFVDVLVTYDVGGRAVALVAGEAVGGLGLLSTQIGRRRRGADVALAVALLWSALGVQAFARGLALESCGCFGVHLAQPLRWWVLLQDAEFVALAVLSRRRARRTPVPTPTVDAVEV